MAEGNGFIMKNGQEAPADEEPRLPRVDFSSFILSLYSSVLVQLGKIEDPSTGKTEKDLDLARQTIDMMAMLKEKTKGNLDTEEENLTETLLRELRLAFVEAKA